MRKIKYIAVHCTASRQTWTVADLKKEFKRKGWQNPGYHYVITADGKIHMMLSPDKVSNGVQGYNYCAVNVAYVGGINPQNVKEAVDNRTEAQKKSLINLLKRLRQMFPNAIIQGHRDFPKVSKACPCFDAKTEYSDI